MRSVRRVSNCYYRSVVGFALALAVGLTPQLEAWRAEIERVGAMKTHILSLRAGAAGSLLELPADTPEREILAPFAGNANFAGQFRGAQALSVQTKRPGTGEAVSFVLVNPELAGEGEALEAVLAHELGHLWLKAQRYPTPAYSGGESACLAIHAGDAVQHVLIREEMEKRGVHWRGPWIASLEQALGAMEADRGKPRVTPGRCQALGLAGLWVDAALSLDGETWPRFGAFFESVRERFPEVAPVADQVVKRLRGMELRDKGVHREAVREVYERFRQLALRLPA